MVDTTAYQPPIIARIAEFRAGRIARTRIPRMSMNFYGGITKRETTLIIHCAQLYARDPAEYSIEDLAVCALDFYQKAAARPDTTRAVIAVVQITSANARDIVIAAQPDDVDIPRTIQYLMDYDPLRAIVSSPLHIQRSDTIAREHPRKFAMLRIA